MDGMRIAKWENHERSKEDSRRAAPRPVARLSTFHHFTLVELLVVVAIIAILAAMLLPVLGKAIESSRIVTCNNNLKQLYLGMAAYADERSAWVLTTCAKTHSSHEWMQYYVTGQDKWLGVYWGSIAISPLWRCPTETTYNTKIGSPYKYKYYYWGRGMLGFDGLGSLKLSRVRHPTRQLFMADSDAFATNISGYGYGLRYRHLRPPSRSAFLFMDGHTGLFGYNGDPDVIFKGLGQ